MRRMRKWWMRRTPADRSRSPAYKSGMVGAWGVPAPAFGRHLPMAAMASVSARRASARPSVARRHEYDVMQDTSIAMLRLEIASCPSRTNSDRDKATPPSPKNSPGGGCSLLHDQRFHSSQMNAPRSCFEGGKQRNCHAVAPPDTSRVGALCFNDVEPQELRSELGRVRAGKLPVAKPSCYHRQISGDCHSRPVIELAVKLAP